MAITADEALMCLEAPERTTPSRRDGQEDDCVYYIRGNITLVVRFVDKVVITAVWNRMTPNGISEPRFTREET
jgi:hypothetical protein